MNNSSTMDDILYSNQSQGLGSDDDDFGCQQLTYIDDFTSSTGTGATPLFRLLVIENRNHVSFHPPLSSLFSSPSTKSKFPRYGPCLGSIID